MKRKAAQVALVRLTNNLPFPRITRNNICDDEKIKNRIKNTALEKVVNRETRSTARQKADTSKQIDTKKSSSGKSYKAASIPVRKSLRTESVNKLSSSVECLSSEETKDEKYSSEETEFENKTESEEENEVKPRKIFKRDNNCANSRSRLDNLTSVRGITRSSNQQRKNGDLSTTPRKSEMTSADQQKPVSQAPRELRNRTMDPENERKSVNRKISGFHSSLARKVNAPCNRRSSEFLRKRLRKIRTRSQKEKCRLARKTAGGVSGSNSIHRAIACRYKLRNVQVNLVKVRQTLKINEADGQLSKVEQRQEKKSEASSSDTKSGETSSSPEQKSSGQSKDFMSEEVHIISDSEDCDDESEDVICLSSSRQLELNFSGSHNACPFEVNDTKRPPGHPSRRWNAFVGGVNLADRFVNSSSERADGSSVGGMSAVDIISIFNSLQNSFLKMKADFELQLHEKDRIIQRLQEEPHLQYARLKNELEWKSQQVEELSKAAEHNIELEAKVSHLLSDRKAYEEEVKKMHQKGCDHDGDEGSADIEAMDEKDNEADEIEKLLIGLKETPDDHLFSVGAIPLASCEQRPIRMPESNITPKIREFDKTAVPNTFQRKGRHDIRRLVSRLQEETKTAAILEAERRDRVKKERLNHMVTMGADARGQPVCTRMVLAFKDEKSDVPLVEVDAELLGRLKPHQVEAVEFMWDCIVESVERLKKERESRQVESGNGCILAHCMGLGKTLSVITFMQTVLKCELGFKRCLIVSPLNAVLNWVSEWEKWVRPELRLPIYDLACRTSLNTRVEVLTKWFKDGGILIIGYSLFRILINYRGRSKRLKTVFSEMLLDPGPDIIVCDEGHIVKSDSSAISKCLNCVSTKRRIVLTGTPLQNNLIEYHCMVNFVRPNLLGTRQEFCNRFVNPITNGQHSDSTLRDVQLMKKRAHVLHQMLSGCIQRRDYSDLKKFLPPKHEYVISVRLSQLQIDLYETSLETVRGSEVSRKVTGAVFFSDYQNLMRIWTHPWILKMEQMRQDQKPLSFSDDDLESLIYASEEEEKEDEDNAVLLRDKEKTSQVTKQSENCEETDEEDLFLGDAENSRKAIESFIAALLEAEEMEESGEASDEQVGLGNVKNGEENADEADTMQIKDPSYAGIKEIIEENYSDEKSAEGFNDCLLSSESRKEIGVNEENKETGDKELKKQNLEEEDEDIIINSDSLSNGEEQEFQEDGNVLNLEDLHKKVFGEEILQNLQSKMRMSETVQESDANKIRPFMETWWSSLVDDGHHLVLELSGKLFLLFEILRLAKNIDDKVLVFSQSLLSLDLIEDFLSQKNEDAIQYNATLSFGMDDKSSRKSLWIKDEDYIRMDGSTGALARRRLTNSFNDESNRRLRLFLISTKAGGLGINLDSANRVIIFDASWNPSHDIQSIFRVYRFGQKKPVYIYRFVAQGTMEEKIYDRQVTKETLSHRVLDEQQIDRHFTAADLNELYVFKPARSVQSDPINQQSLPVPKDFVLAELISEQRRWIVGYHDHDSLLERRPEEDLSEEERKSAWEEYEKERQGLISSFTDFRTVLGDSNPSLSCPTSASASISVWPDCTFASKSELISKEKTGQAVPTLARFCSNIVELVTSHIPVPVKSRFNFQMSHLPRVVEEIIKYNPDITVENLQKRINAFVGIHAT